MAQLCTFCTMIFAVSLMLFFQFYGYRSKALAELLPYWGDDCATDACKSNEAVYRVGSAVWAFFATVSLACAADPADNDAGWANLAKPTALLALLAIAACLPADVVLEVGRIPGRSVGGSVGRSVGRSGRSTGRSVGQSVGHIGHVGQLVGRSRGGVGAAFDGRRHHRRHRSGRRSREGRTSIGAGERRRERATGGSTIVTHRDSAPRTTGAPSHERLFRRRARRRRPTAIALAASAARR